MFDRGGGIGSHGENELTRFRCAVRVQYGLMIEDAKPTEQLAAVFELTHDFAILDRYQAFSAELIRLALAGIAAVGIFVAWVTDTNHMVTGGAKLLFGLALFFFGVAAAAALGHRYWSTDSMTAYVSMRRTNAKLTGATDGLLSPKTMSARDRTVGEARYLRDKDDRDLAFRFSTITLAVSSGSLLSGAVALGAGVLASF